MSVANNTNYHSMYDSSPMKLFPNYQLQSTSYQGKLESINRSLDDCTVWVNFWGARELVSKSDVDMPIVPINLGTVGSRVLEVGYENCRWGQMRIDEDLSPNDLKLKNEICQKLKNFYSVSDIQVSNSWSITKIFNSIREEFRPFAWVVNFIGSVSGYGMTCPSDRSSLG